MQNKELKIQTPSADKCRNGKEPLIFFGDMWRDIEEDAIFMGLDLNYFWSLNPKQWSKHVNVFAKKDKMRINEIDTLNYVLGKYVGFAINNPKNYPKKPFSDSEVNSEIMTDAEMEKQARRNTIKMGGVINDS